MSTQGSSKLIVLEGLRGLAASYVVLHHVAPFQHTPAEWLTRFGQEAVTVFFLLSGFVIHYSFASAQDQSARSYLVKRFRRIYPPFIMALGLTALARLWLVGPGVDLKPKELVLNLLMLQDHEFLRPGSIARPYLNNGVLWSLSYEWWFYLLYYPIVTRVPPSKWLACVTAIVGAGFVAFLWTPSFFARVAMLFGVWWLGVEMARAYLAQGRVELRPVIPGMALAAATAGALLLNAFWVSRTMSTSLGRYPWIEPRIVCVALVLAVIGVLWHRYAFKGLRSLLRGCSFVAPISYCLYVFHPPLLWLRELDAAPDGAAGTALALAVAIALSYAVEVRLQPRINRWLR